MRVSKYLWQLNSLQESIAFIKVDQRAAELIRHCWSSLLEVPRYQTHRGTKTGFCRSNITKDSASVAPISHVWILLKQLLHCYLWWHQGHEVDAYVSWIATLQSHLDDNIIQYDPDIVGDNAIPSQGRGMAMMLGQRLTALPQSSCNVAVIQAASRILMTWRRQSNSTRIIALRSAGTWGVHL
jgi:hypothetical protein